MARIVRPVLRRSVAMGDALARRAGGRVVASRDLGLAYGEHLLRQCIELLGVDLVLDVGANRGQFGRKVRTGTGYSGLIHSYEPLAAAFAKLAEQAARDPRWTAQRCALAAETGSVTIHLMADDQFSSALLPSDAFDGRFNGRLSIVGHETVPAVTLPDAVANMPTFRCGLLKLDTQGTELAILEAGQRVLPRFGAVLVEVGFARLYEGEPAFDDVRQAMAAWGYSLSGLFPNNHGHFPSLLQMDALFIRTDRLPTIT
jgi:FkbM family methyltransferase